MRDVKVARLARDQLNALTEAVIGAAIAVHRRLGPGLLESVYETCLSYELRRRGLTVEAQKPLPVLYDGVVLEGGYRVDLLVEDAVLVELKSVKDLEPIHSMQLLTYLKLSRREVGLLLNFNVERLRDGIKRLVNGYPDVSV